MNYNSIYAFKLQECWKETVNSVSTQRKWDYLYFVDIRHEGTISEFDAGLYMVDI